MISSLPENHPYCLVEKNEISEALESFKEIMSSTGIKYLGRADTNRGILTPIGTIKTTCLVPETMYHAPTKRDEYMHIISFAGLKDFYPGYITARFHNADFSVYDAGATPTMAIAQQFELEPFREKFISWLKCIDIIGEKVGIPAVLGISSPSEVIREIEEQVKRPVFEIPTLPPSVPGLRMFRALRRRLQQKGGDVYWGKPVASVEKNGRIVEAVTIDGMGRPTRVNGRSFILATGSFVSGGLYAGIHKVREQVFELPVFSPLPRESWFGEDFFPPDHPIEKAGIMVDRFFRPKHVELDNLFICGSILAFSEVMKNGCGHGMAVVTGIAAARSCDRYLK